ncbi:MAG: TrkA family potassium uptake protein [Clostridiales bacterium]|nr:TrkA family potassium uptake protein [Clostridiales bacterium]
MKKNSDKKQYIVIGLGRFGRSVAMQLEANGCMVLAIDDNEKNVNFISEYVTHAICMDVTDEESLKEIGMSNFDGVIVSMGSNLNSAIFAIMSAKEAGVKNVIAKAYDEMAGKVLTKVGADEIIYPEREMGYHLAKNLAFGNFLDAVELTADYSIAEIPVPVKWVGKNLLQLNLRQKYRVNVIAVKRNSELDISPAADRIFIKDDVIVILGKNEVLKKLSSTI